MIHAKFEIYRFDDTKKTFDVSGFTLDACWELALTMVVSMGELQNMQGLIVIDYK